MIWLKVVFGIALAIGAGGGLAFTFGFISGKEPSSHPKYFVLCLLAMIIGGIFASIIGPFALPNTVKSSPSSFK